MPFELTGIPSSTTAKGDSSNFVSVVTYGDPVMEYTFDTEKGSAFVTVMAPEANNEFNHYGKVVTIGDKADSIAMQQKLAGWNSITGKNITSILSILPNFAKYHLPVTQAANMRFKLSLYSLFFICRFDLYSTWPSHSNEQ